VVAVRTPHVRGLIHNDAAFGFIVDRDAIDEGCPSRKFNLTHGFVWINLQFPAPSYSFACPVRAPARQNMLPYFEAEQLHWAGNSRLYIYQSPYAARK
jgi:hypothetical protein